MHRRFLDILADPETREPLALEALKIEGDHFSRAG